MKLSTIRRLCEAYSNTGRVAHLYPRQGRVSLNGSRAMPFPEAAERIRKLLASSGEIGRKPQLDT